MNNTIRILTITVVVGLGLTLYSELVTLRGGFYSEHLPLRWQVESFLDGRLALSISPRGMGWDLVWDNGKVQHVFGLAVPLWQLLFELPARILGAGPFPDRFCFVAALCLATYWILWTATKERFDLGAVYTGLLCSVLLPAFIALCCTRFLVYEEVVAYGYLGTLGLAFGLAHWLNTIGAPANGKPHVDAQLKKAQRQFFGICAFSAWLPFIRATLVFYGIAAVGLAAIVAWVRHIKMGVILSGLAVYCSLIGLLLALNYYRYGSPFEFGHSLNLNGLAAMRYASRFDHPYQDEAFVPAARELVSALFFARYVGVASQSGYEPGLFPGQSHTFRWREIYFSTFGLPELAFLLAAWAIAIGRLISTRWKALVEPPVILGLWSLVSATALFGFYLRFPFISSRYLMDFAPGIAICSWVFWMTALRMAGALNRLGPFPSLVVVVSLLCWWGNSAARIWTREGSSPITFGELRQRMARERARPTEVELPLEYTNATQRAQIPFNLDGWLEDGRTLASIAAFVRDPECLILELAPAGDEPLPLAAYDCIRAKIGLEFLQRESLVQTTNGVRILFSGPKRARYQRGYQVAFIALVPREKLSLGESPFRLHRIAWRRDMLAPSNAIKSDTRTDPNGDEL